MKKRLISMLLVGAMLVMTTACGGKDASAPSGGSASGDSTEEEGTAVDDSWDTPYAETQKVSIARVGISGNNLPEGDTIEDNEWLRWCEEKLNIDIEYAYVAPDGDSYKTRVGLMMSSELPDALIVNRSQYLEMAEAGLLADMTDIIDKYSSDLIREYYDSYDRAPLDYAAVDGRVYAIPSAAMLDGGQPLLWVRGDWREKLNLPEPKTVDDVLAMAEAFATQDPDGNGTDDTVGLLAAKEVTTNQGAFIFDPIFAAYDAFPRSYLMGEDGNVYYGSVQPEAREALERLAQAYKDGAIDPEMASGTWDTCYGKLTSSKAGIYFYPWHGAWAASDLLKTSPDARWEIYAAPENKDGKVVSVNPEMSNEYLVVSKDYEHPELLMKLLSVEYQGLRLLDPEAAEIYKDMGVSWLNWPLTLQLNYSDALVRTAKPVMEAYESKNTDALDTDALMTTYEQYCVHKDKAYEEDPGAWANGFSTYVSSLTNDPKYSFINQAYYGVTETMQERGANLSKLEQETYLKIIIGEEPIEAFDKFVEQWYAEGGQMILDEIQEALQ